MKAQCLSNKRIPSALTLRLLRRGSATRRKRQAGCLLFDPTNRFFPAQNGPAVTSDPVAITARSASLPHHMACACNSLRRGSCDVADLGAAASGFSKSSRYDPDGVRALGAHGHSRRFGRVSPISSLPPTTDLETGVASSSSLFLRVRLRRQKSRSKLEQGRPMTVLVW